MVPTMAEDYLRARRLYLLAVQNADGGWGYLAGKQSWLEPTAYAMLALHGDQNASRSLARAWTALRSWQAADGGWRPGPAIEHSSWTTALAVTLHCVHNVFDQPFQRGVHWLCRTRGQEGVWWKRILNRLQPSEVGHDASLQGWPWLPANSSWVEPTAHALVALKKSRAALQRLRPRDWSLAASRIDMGEKMILDRRCADGGWNYGNRLVQNVTLPSYPETTALALLGLQGNPSLDLRGSVASARALWERSRSPMARAWLALCLRSYGQPLPADGFEPAPPRDTAIAALEALAAGGGNHALLRPEGRG